MTDCKLFANTSFNGKYSTCWKGNTWKLNLDGEMCQRKFCSHGVPGLSLGVAELRGSAVARTSRKTSCCLDPLDEVCVNSSIITSTGDLLSLKPSYMVAPQRQSNSSVGVQAPLWSCTSLWWSVTKEANSQITSFTKWIEALLDKAKHVDLRTTTSRFKRNRRF